MLEFFRRHRGAFMIFIAVVVIITFSFWGGPRTDAVAPNDPTRTMFTIYGHSYSKAEMDRLERYMRLAYMLGLYELPGQLTQLARKMETESETPVDFVFNLLVLRKEMERNGIAVSDAEAKAELQKLPAFQNNGVFDPARASMAEENLGAMGFRSPDMLDLMRDKIGLDKLKALVAGNIIPSTVAVEKSYARQYQTVKAATITFLLDDFKKQAKVTDDEISKYYEEKKAGYQTAEQRAVSYVYFEEPQNLDGLNAEQRNEAQLDYGKRVNAFVEAANKPGARLEILAAAAKAEELTLKLLPRLTRPNSVRTGVLPLFSRDNPPDAIKDEADLIKAIFFHNPDAHAISDPIKGAKGYYLFTVLRAVAPRQQTLAEVKERIREALVLQKGQEAMLKAANEARDALQAGLKGGKKLPDLAKEKKLLLVELPEYSPAAPSPDIKAGREITEAAAKLPAGQLSAPVDTDVGAALVFVSAKELRKRDDSATLKQGMQDSMVFREQFDAFKAWFEKRREAAGLEVFFASA